MDLAAARDKVDRFERRDRAETFTEAADLEKRYRQAEGLLALPEGSRRSPCHFGLN